jgi:multidrug transporter EmrE-like cation transporter
MSEFLSTELGKWVGILFSVLAGALAQTLMKAGTRAVGPFGETPFFQYVLKLLTTPLIIGAIIAYGVGVIVYMFMLSRVDLSVLYPIMTALGLIIATLISAALFQEQVSVLRLAGIAVVIFGVFLVARS